jgi:hypothetical protein
MPYEADAEMGDSYEALCHGGCVGGACEARACGTVPGDQVSWFLRHGE